MPNTILITVDALRRSRLQQYGADRNPMPILDELAKEGTKFTSAFANGPYTGVSIRL
jgi:arylsulfatase A-like enzyme